MPEPRDLRPPKRTGLNPTQRLLLMILCCTAPVGLIVLFLGVRWAQNEMAKADPIPGITITVDPGGAPDPKSIEHAAHAFLNRRLREVGYTDATANPLTIDVTFKKIGAEKFDAGTKVVEADKLHVEVRFKNSRGRATRTIHLEPKVPSHQAIGTGDEAILLNKAMYNRAVDELRNVKLPKQADVSK